MIKTQDTKHHNSYYKFGKGTNDYSDSRLSKGPHAGKPYNKRLETIAWKTVCNFCDGNPCSRPMIS